MTIDAPEAVPAPIIPGVPEDVPADELAGSFDEETSLGAMGEVGEVAHVGLPELAHTTEAGAPRDLRLLADVPLELSVQLGRARLPLRELLALAPGSVLELDRTAGEPVDVLVNGRLIARGEVVVVDGDFGVRISEITDPHGTG